MKKYLICLAVIGSFWSCEDDSDTSGLSSVTEYPVITVNGDSPIFLSVGEAFEDPGAIALEGDDEIPVTTTARGTYRGQTTLNTAVADVYNLIYTATNQDGFNGTATRQVIVSNTGDLVNSLEGVYTSTVYRNGTQGAPAANYTDIEYILIWQNANGTYQISDGFGGWYEFGRALGVTYAAPGATFTANNIAANDFTFGPTFTNTSFGGTANITEIEVNPETNQITVNVVWQADAATTYNFQYVLTQVQF